MAKKPNASKKVAKTKPSQAELLDLELGTLQSDCDAAETRYVGARQELYNNIVRIYYWWRKADAQKGYLDAKIEQMGGLFKKESKHGYNFSPVLQLVYGNTISDHEISKRGRVLNSLHEEYKKAPKKYGTDVVKLANHIGQKGGLSKMVQESLPDVPSLKVLEKLIKQQEVSGVAPAAMPSSLEFQVAKQNALDKAIVYENSTTALMLGMLEQYLNRKKYIDKPSATEKVRLTPAIKQSKLADDAQTYWKKHKGLGLIASGVGIDTDTSNFGLAVVKADPKGVAFIDTFIDDALIKQALVVAYEKQLAALPSSLRCMYETLRTQLVPKHVAEKVSGKKQHSDTQRLVYASNTNQFVLSAIRSTAGVCTIVKPSASVMPKCGYDIFMQQHTKDVIEQMLDEQTINCYRPAAGSALQAHEKPYRHSIQVTSIADPSDFYFLNFYPYFTNSPWNFEQVMFDVGYEKTIKTKLKLPRDLAREIAKRGADKWLAGKGHHAARKSNSVAELSISNKVLNINFDYKDGKSVAPFVFPMPNSTKLTGTYKQKFVCLDLMPVLSTLGALDLTTDVQLLVDKNVAVFKFATDAGAFVIAVPTCDDKGNRVASTAFGLRKPVTYTATDNYYDLIIESYVAHTSDYFPENYSLNLTEKAKALKNGQ